MKFSAIITIFYYYIDSLTTTQAIFQHRLNVPNKTTLLKLTSWSGV